ncbi:hypothetical protein I4U23_010502 [Adineta vaga]|nr:hypothetical protein I4U23_010502 [Adineta vaga]
MIDNEQKQKVISDMEMTIEILMEKLVIIDDPIELLKESIDNQTVKSKKIMSYVLQHITQVQSDTKVQRLAELMAHICVEQKSLIDINHQLNLLDNEDSTSSKRIFLKKTLVKISDIIANSGASDFDSGFITNYARLCAVLFAC